jgi:hypothetical protein
LLVRRVVASGMTLALVSGLGLVRVSRMKVLKDDFEHYKLNVVILTSALG